MNVPDTLDQMLVPSEVAKKMWADDFTKLKVCKVKGDGDCLFHAVNVALGTNHDISEMRQQVYDTLVARPQLIPPDIPNGDVSFILHEKHWNNSASDMMLLAIAIAYKLIITVYVFTQDNPGNIIIVKGEGNANTLQPISLMYTLYFSNLHYDALIPSTQDCPDPNPDFVLPSEQELVQKCNATRDHIIQALSTKGCSNLGLNRMSDQQLCELFAIYQSKQYEDVIIPQELKAIHQDLSFSINLKYIIYASSNLPKCPTPPADLGAIIDANESGQPIADEDVQINLQCYIRHILSQSTNWLYHNTLKSDALGIPALLAKVRQFLSFKKIAQGKYGKTFQAYVNGLTKPNGENYPPVAVLKLALDSLDEQNRGVILHEMAIGYAINTIRQQTNYWFAYTYGGFFCDADANFDKICMQTYSKNFNNTKVLSFQQFVPMAFTTINKWMKEISYKYPQLSRDFYIKNLNAFLVQIATALYHAQESLQFMHFDLHTDNVLVRNTPYERDAGFTTIECKAGSFKYTLHGSADYPVIMPSIIDYGLSVATVKQQDGQKAILINRWPCDNSNVYSQRRNIASLGNGTYGDKYFLPLYDFFQYMHMACLLPFVNRDEYDAQGRAHRVYTDECLHACIVVMNQWFHYLQTRLRNGSTEFDWNSRKFRTWNKNLYELLNHDYTSIDDVITHAVPLFLDENLSTHRLAASEGLIGYFATYHIDSGGSMEAWLNDWLDQQQIANNI